MLNSLERSCYNHLLNHCLEAYPEEACGLLLAPAASSSITSAIAITNVHEHKSIAFRFDPQQWVQAYYMAQQQGLHIVGIYHSHPTEEAIPSTSDLNGSLDKQMLHAIISLKQKNSPQIKFYRMIEENQFINYPLVLT